MKDLKLTKYEKETLEAVEKSIKDASTIDILTPKKKLELQAMAKQKLNSIQKDKNIRVVTR